MTLFFEFDVSTALTDLAVLLHAFDVLFPAFSLLILLMETQSTQSVSRLLAEHGEDCTLSSWHNGPRIRI